MTMNSTAPKIAEEAGDAEWRSLNIVQNALRVAGSEMGEGDHWPAIRATLRRLASDYEQYQAELAVSEELRAYVGEILATFERAAAECDRKLDPESAAEFGAVVAEMRDIYEAGFAPVDPVNLPNVREAMEKRPDFAPYRWAENIMSMLEGDGI